MLDIKGKEYTTEDEQFVAENVAALTSYIRDKGLDKKPLRQTSTSEEQALAVQHLRETQPIKGRLGEDYLRFTDFFISMGLVVNISEERLRAVLGNAIQRSLSSTEKKLLAQLAYFGGWISGVERDEIMANKHIGKYTTNEFCHYLVRGRKKRKMQEGAEAKNQRAKGIIPYLSSDWVLMLFGDRKEREI